MLESIKGILIITILCIMLIIISKVGYLLKYIISNKRISIIDEIKELDYENFYYLSLEALSERGFENFSIINDGILKCTKNNEDYMIVLDNNKDEIGYNESEILYGYMVTYEIKNILFFMTGKLSDGAKEFFHDINVDVIYYGDKYIVEDYSSIIRNI